MAVHSSELKKRKQPPTFRHLPRSRAQKLKKSWIEKKKLKVRWKAQRAKQVLDSGWPDPSSSRRAQDEGQEHSEKVHKHDRSRVDRLPSPPVASDSEDKDDSSGSERPPLPRRKAQATVPQVDDSHSQRRKRNRLGPTEASPDDAKEEKNSNESKTSLRELARRAYAPSSLHTQKADPLHRRKGTLVSLHSSQPSRPGHSNGKDAVRSSSSAFMASGRHSRERDNARGSKDDRQQSRGQPIMKLRMEAMLERIKRDYS